MLIVKYEFTILVIKTLFICINYLYGQHFLLVCGWYFLEFPFRSCEPQKDFYLRRKFVSIQL